MRHVPHENNVRRVVAELEALGAKPEDLDEAVHDLAGFEAASVNNAGPEAQAEALGRTADPDAPGDALDDEVHDLYSHEASEANNQGLNAQVRYVAAHVGEKDLLGFILTQIGRAEG